MAGIDYSKIGKRNKKDQELSNFMKPEPEPKESEADTRDSKVDVNDSKTDTKEQY
jgi:hypothetical protein